MLSRYIARKLQLAQYKLLKDGSYFGEVPGVRGVWANTADLESCRGELRDVLEEWLLLKVHNRERVPGLKLRIGRRSVRNA